MRTILQSLLILAISASAQAVPFTINFNATETPAVGLTSDFDLMFSITNFPDVFTQTVHYDLASQTFSVAGTDALESFTAQPGSNSFQDLWTLDYPENTKLTVRIQTSNPQAFSSVRYNNLFGEGNPQNYFADYLVTNPAALASLTFNLDDPGVGAILFAPVGGGGAPELDASRGKMAIALFALGLGVLASRKKFTPGLVS